MIFHLFLIFVASLVIWSHGFYEGRRYTDKNSVKLNKRFFAGDNNERIF